MFGYTIKNKEQEFYKHLEEIVEEFETAIEDDDKSKLNQDTCDIMLTIKRF